MNISTNNASAAGVQKGGKKKTLGFWMSTSLVVGTMVGSGVFLLPASLAPYGGIALVGWIVTTIGAISLGLVFSQLVRMIPKSGGPYTFTRAGFGDFSGFLVAWGYWIAIWAGNAAIAVAMVAYLEVFIPVLQSSQILAAVVAIGVVWLLTAVNISGVRNAGIVQLLTTVLCLIPLVFVAFFGLMYFNKATFVPFNASSKPLFTAIATTAALTLWAYLGVESATVPAIDVKNPTKTIPRATIVGVLIAATVYILGTISVMSTVSPEKLVASSSPYAEAAKLMWGSWAMYFISFGAVAATLGTLNGWLLLQGQVPLAAAKDGLFPRVFGHTAKHGTPTTGMLISSILVTILILMNFSKRLVAAYTFIVLLATLNALIPIAFCSMAELMIFIKEREKFQGKRLLGSTLIACLAFLYSLFAIWGAGAETVLWGFLFLLGSIPVYVLIKRQGAKNVVP